ncbi:RimJ/RimL family protein N-acetyltransferase [Actinomadura luteofluorescens]|uniref:RimJ/RimL family protein N-acetyltransferase n=1 Tax=Actinomadura luteofluorescens TaxID=46163 RepID=A0A7Y9EH40_9ACTN|nr:GNAT family N-acetyltransferase [Actinomadura luteofluorescens]NYD47681.1 RimJ/RimL family protein N-acetyltransferase [Actinomadura luteofluorescens]
MLTLARIAEAPSVLTRHLESWDGARLLFRPLARTDAESLAGFLAGLSSETRRFSTFDGYDLAAARELCAAIARYDKLRLVLEEEASARIVGLLEFSLALTQGDVERYRQAGIHLNEETDCRFGLTLSDDQQSKGLATLVFPLICEVAWRLGKRRIILWGGVLADNPRAIRFYEKNGFQRVGPFTGPDGRTSLDMILDIVPPPAGTPPSPR